MTRSAPALRRAGSPSLASGALPTELLERVPRRLSAMALVYALVYLSQLALGPILALLRGKDDWLARQLETLPPDVVSSYWKSFPLGYVTGTVAVLGATALYVVVRSWRGSPRQLARVGHAFAILGALGIALIEQSYLRDGYGIGISWVCVWITIYPVVVPAPPRVAVGIALVAATAGPLGYLLATAAGNQPGTASQLVFMFYPNYVCALAAYFTARVLQRFGEQVREARQLGAYTLDELIGKGGMGEVWAGSHRLLARRAAVKLVQPERLGLDLDRQATALRRFEREARATATLTSPHTVELYDFGQADDGTLYYVMELLDGVDLRELVERHGPLPPERAVHLLLGVCDSLADAHAHGLVHRDIKPANIFVCRVGVRVDFPKVLDFGLVKATAVDPDQPDPRVSVTQDGAPLGTPAFTAPEIVLGEREVDHRADLYSLGCVAYWLLTGQLVFDRKTSMKTLLAHAGEAPVPPSERLGAPIPEALEALVLDLLAKDPDQRPSTAAALEARLRALDLAPLWDAERSLAWWRAHLPAARDATGPSEEPAARGS